MVKKQGLIYISRHGETEWNIHRRTQGQTDIPLTDKGKQQAVSLAGRLLNENIGQIISSDLKRAYETATIVGRHLKLEVEPSPMLREISFGCWEGSTIDEIEENYPGGLKKWRTNHDFCPDKGESLLDLSNRVKKFISSMDYKKLEDSNLLLVSHGITCKVLILELMGMPLDYIMDFKIANTGLCVIDTTGKKNAVVYLNDFCHLREL